MRNLTRDILQSPRAERWYGDGEPTWRQGRKQQPAKTLAEARQDRLRAIKLLKRHGKGQLETRALMRKLKACHPGHRCTSGACPECGRAFQRWWTHAGSKFLARQTDPVAVVHAVSASGRITAGALR